MPNDNELIGLELLNYSPEHTLLTKQEKTNYFGDRSRELNLQTFSKERSFPSIDNLTQPEESASTNVEVSPSDIKPPKKSQVKGLSEQLKQLKKKQDAVIKLMSAIGKASGERKKKLTQRYNSKLKELKRDQKAYNQKVDKRYPNLNRLPKDVSERFMGQKFPQTKERPLSKEALDNVISKPDVFESPLGRIAGSFGQGVLGIGEGIAGAAEYAGIPGAKPVGDKISEIGKAIAPQDPNFAENLTSGLGSMVTFLLPGMGVAKGAQVLFKNAPKIAQTLGLGTMTFLESATEAGSIYRETNDPRAAEKTFLANMLLVGLTNRYDLTGQGKRALKQILTQAPLEAIQEGGQGVISETVKGKSLDQINWDNILEQTAIGGIIGGGTASMLGSRNLKPKEALNRLKELGREEGVRKERLPKDLSKGTINLDESFETGAENLRQPSGTPKTQATEQARQPKEGNAPFETLFESKAGRLGKEDYDNYVDGYINRIQGTEYEKREIKKRSNDIYNRVNGIEAQAPKETTVPQKEQPDNNRSAIKRMLNEGKKPRETLKALGLKQNNENFKLVREVQSEIEQETKQQRKDKAESKKAGKKGKVEQTGKLSKRKKAVEDRQEKRRSEGQFAPSKEYKVNNKPLSYRHSEYDFITENRDNITGIEVFTEGKKLSEGGQSKTGGGVDVTYKLNNERETTKTIYVDKPQDFAKELSDYVNSGRVKNKVNQIFGEQQPETPSQKPKQKQPESKKTESPKTKLAQKYGDEIVSEKESNAKINREGTEIPIKLEQPAKNTEVLKFMTDEEVDNAYNKAIESGGFEGTKKEFKNSFANDIFNAQTGKPYEVGGSVEITKPLRDKQPQTAPQTEEQKIIEEGEKAREEFNQFLKDNNKYIKQDGTPYANAPEQVKSKFNELNKKVKTLSGKLEEASRKEQVRLASQEAEESKAGTQKANQLFEEQLQRDEQDVPIDERISDKLADNRKLTKEEKEHYFNNQFAPEGYYYDLNGNLKKRTKEDLNKKLGEVEKTSAKGEYTEQELPTDINYITEENYDKARQRIVDNIEAAKQNKNKKLQTIFEKQLEDFGKNALYYPEERIQKIKKQYVDKYSESEIREKIQNQRQVISDKQNENLRLVTTARGQEDLKSYYESLSDLELATTARGREDLSPYYESLSDLEEDLKPYYKHLSDLEDALAIGKSLGKYKSGRLVSDDQYNQAKKNIRDKGQRLSAGIDPTLLKDYAVVGVYHLENITKAGIEKSKQFREWSKKMIQEFGSKIRPYLDDIYNETQKYKIADTQDERVQRLNREVQKTEQTKNTKEEISRKIKDLRKGYKAGSQATKEELTKLKQMIRDYARKNLPKDSMTRGKITPLLTQISKADNIEKVGKAFSKINQIARTTEKRKLLGQIRKLAKKAKVEKTESNRKKGKAGAEAARVHEKIRKVLDKDVDKEIEKLSTLQATARRTDKGELATGLTDEEQLDFYVLNTFGNIKTKNLDQLKKAYKDLDNLIKDGRVEFLEKERQRAERRDKEINEVVNIIAPEGTKEVEQTNILDKIRNFFPNTFRFHQRWRTLLETMANDKAAEDESKIHKHSDRIDEAERKKEEFILRFDDEYQKAAEKIFGKKGAKLFLEKMEYSTNILKNVKVTLYRNGKKIKFEKPQNEMYKKWMEWQREQARDGLEAMGYTQEVIDDIWKQLDPKIQKWAEWQLYEFYPKIWGEVNKVYRELNNIDLPYDPFYNPIFREHSGGNALNEHEKFLLKSNEHGSVHSRFLKETTKNAKPLSYVDGDLVLQRYLREMSHYIGYGEAIRDIRSVFGSEEVQGTIQKKYGNIALKMVNDAINDIAVDSTGIVYGLADKIRKNFTIAMLGGGLTLVPKQLMSIPAYAGEIGFTNYAKGLKELSENPKKLLTLEKYFNLYGESTFIKNRWKKGHTRDTILALKRGYGRTIMLPTRVGDMGAILIGGLPVFEYHYNEALKTMSETEARKFAIKKFEKITEETQQTGKTKDLSWLQRLGSFGKMFTVFMTAQNSYFQKSLIAARNLAKGRGKRTDNLRKLIVFHTVLPTLFQYAASGLPGLLSDWDEKDEMRLLRAASIGSLNGLFIAGNFIEWFANWVIAEDKFWKQPFSVMETVGQDLQQAAIDLAKRPFDLTEAIDSVSEVSSVFLGIPYERIKKIIKQNIDVGEVDFDNLQDLLKRIGYSDWALGEEDNKTRLKLR